MNLKQSTIIFLVVMISLTLTQGTATAGRVYVGAHAGKILLKDNVKDNFNEDHYSGGLIVGMYALEFKQSVLAVEGDFSVPLTNGTSEDFGEWKLSTAGLYGCLRVGQKGVFLKVKAGMVYENLGVEAQGAEGTNDLGLSLGLGGGFQLGEKVFLEIEAVVIDENIGYLRGSVGYCF